MIVIQKSSPFSGQTPAGQLCHPHRHLHNNIKIAFAFLTCVAKAVMVEEQEWVKLLTS